MISGIFENCIGSEQAQPALQYWAELGYREIQRGHLSAEAAHALYGYASSLTSIRLQNGNIADHGLVRIMVWEQPRNAGLQKAHPFVIGSRWFASLVQDIYAVADAFNDDNANGSDWVVTEPIRGIEFIGQPATNFYQRFTGVREFFVIGTETRQAFFQRYNYTRPGYGVIDPTSPLGVSEGTHSSIVTTGHDTTTFYTYEMTVTLAGCDSYKSSHTTDHCCRVNNDRTSKLYTAMFWVADVYSCRLCDRYSYSWICSCRPAKIGPLPSFW